MQGRRASTAGLSFDDLDGETSTTLSFTASAVQDGEEYRAVFTNSLGSATTDAATLTVDAAPVVTINPKDQLVNAGQKAIFNRREAKGPFPGVQWQVSTDGGATFANVTGVEANVLVLVFTASAGQSGNEYRAVFTNSFGSATTTAATLTVTVTAAPVVTTNPANQAVSAGQTATFTAAATGSPAPTVQWQVSTDGGSTFANIAGATSTTLSFTAGTGESGDEYRAVFTNASGTATTTAATLTVSQATIASTVGVAWGTVGTATLQTDATDHLRLLPDGRSTDLPWLGINRITITLSAPESLTAADVSVHGVNVANYGPVTISGSGTTYTITLAQPINAADRVTVTIGNDSIATFTRRLDVLPGDVNDDGAVNSQDAVIVRNEYLAFAPVTIPMMFLDVNGDGVVDATDYGLVHNRAATHLPS